MNENWKEALRRINRNKKNKSKKLDLSGLELTELPEELWDCTWVEELGLGRIFWNTKLKLWGNNHKRSANFLTNLDGIQRLTELRLLFLDSNIISDLSSIKALTKLKKLDVSQNKLSDCEGLQDLTELEDLDLYHNQISDYEQLVYLKKLKILNLNDNHIVHCGLVSKLTSLQDLALGQNQIMDCSPLGNLVNLQSLNLSRNEITNCQFVEKLIHLKSLDLSSNLIEDCTAIRHLPDLEFLNIDSNKIQDCKALSTLSKLVSLEAGSNPLTNFNFLTNLKGLKRLSLRSTKFHESKLLKNLINLYYLDLGHSSWSSDYAFGDLINLERLDLSGSALSYFPMEVIMLPKLKSINLLGNNLINVPSELTFSNAYRNIKNFYLDLKKNFYLAFDAKQIIVGNGRVGKTSLLKTLYGFGYFDLNEDSTHGIQLFDVNLPLPQKQTIANVSIWDFGGQELYHATHRIFMQTRALYIVVWDLTTENNLGEETVKLHGQNYTFRNYPLSYWLGNIRAVSQRAKIIVVCNKADNEQECFPAELQALQQEYQIDSFITVSAKTGYGISNLYQRIQYLLGQMPEMGMQMPVSWRGVKEKLTTIRTQKPYIHIDEYHTVAATEDLSSGSMDTLLNFLHHSGFLFWNVHHLKNHPILDQKWALEAIYQLLDRNGWYPLLKGNALRQRSELAKCWSTYSTEQVDLFLEMMQSCELALKLEDKQSDNPHYLIPEFLPDTAPAVADIWEATTGPIYHFRFQHPFFHAALIQRFIVRSAKLAERYDLLWRTGLLLKVENTLALVQVYPEAGRIDMQLRGTNPDYLLERLKNEITEIQEVDEEAGFLLSLTGQPDEWVTLEQLQLQISKGKTHVASTTGEILELAPFRLLLSSMYPDQDDDQESPGLKELSDRETGLQLLIPTPPPNPLEGLKLLVKKELINEGIGAAITCLETHLHTDSTPATDLIVISSQFQAFNRNVAKGLHSVDEQYLLANRISNQVVALLTTIQEADLK